MGVLKWPGAKWSLATKIVDIIPEHKIYLEPFFGSGAVFFNKAPCNTEVLNDLDADIINLFKCIRDYPKELAALIELTPYAREEFKKSYNREGVSKLERARLFIVRCNMARAGMQYYSSSWRHSGPVLGATCNQRVTGAWNKLPEYIFEAAKRLKEAEIENTNAIELIEKYNRSDCLIYADPPYLLSTRRQRYYNVEMEKDEQHEELIKILLKHSGPVMLSGYDSDLYNDYLSRWTRYEFTAQAEQGKTRREVIWVNRCDNQLSLFE
ncbi:MAG: DNA adenine methylase [Candidatus Galacturonibacter soehngenii]|nr:DNA adenine methylase [Candidatus Galacturonibacter soehngenii]